MNLRPKNRYFLSSIQIFVFVIVARGGRHYQFPKKNCDHHSIITLLNWSSMRLVYYTILKRNVIDPSSWLKYNLTTISNAFMHELITWTLNFLIITIWLCYDSFFIRVAKQHSFNALLTVKNYFFCEDNIRNKKRYSINNLLSIYVKSKEQNSVWLW